MKKIFYSLILGSLLLNSGCGKEFLETEPTQLISADQVAEASKLNPELQNANLAGIYANMYLTGTGGTNLDHDDFGHRGYDIFTDMVSGDMVLYGVNYGWYTGIANLTETQDFTDNTNYKPWRYYYRIIRGANIVIDGLGGNESADLSEEAKALMGQAKTMRAYGYFYLVNLYTDSYNPSSPALPLYVNTVDPNQPLSTQEDVYKQIIKDLTESEVLLANFTRESFNEVNIWVTKGLL
jgi:hypothetical protein